MPLFYSQTIDQYSSLAIWHIAETEDFFLEKVPLSRAITHPHKRLQHLAGRYLLQFLYPDFPIHLIQIANTLRPYLATESLHFSISHCGDYAAAIVSTQKRVGIDIELHSPRIERIQHKFLNEVELELGKKGISLFPTLIWSAKEAMFKWYSLGEVDFQQHLQIKKMTVNGFDGEMQATLYKEPAVEMIIPFKTWDSLVLTWVCL